MTTACPACVAMPMAQEVAAGPALQFSLPGVHCAACIGKIERGLESLRGVTSVRVNLSLKRVSIAGPVDADRALAALEGLGFEAYPLDLAALASAQDTTGRALLIRLAVAGFAMMNVMLLSVAVWSGAQDATRDLFHLISAMIALPTVGYAGQPFFLNALSALKVGRLNMDVPISLAIILAAGMSLFETLNGGQHAYFDAALSLTFFLLIGRYLDHQTRSAARSAAKELTALEVHTAQVLIDGQSRKMPVQEITAGDLILVPTGARIPVDGTLTSASALLDRSLVTGESRAAKLAEGANVQAGEVNLAAPVTLRAAVNGSDTSLRRMAAMVELAENGRNRYTGLADRAAQIYAPAVHLLAFAAFVAWFFATGDTRHALNIAIAVLIITCPCALGLAVPAVSTAAISKLYSNGFLVKHATALERLAEVDHIVLDKTGTLTLPAGVDVSRLSAEEKSIAAALAQGSAHVWSQALLAALEGVKPADLTVLKEQAGNGIEALWQSQLVALGRGAWLGDDAVDLGLKIGDAPATVLQKHENLRPGIAEALEAIGLPCEMLTGDDTSPARAIAARLDLPMTANARPEEKLTRLEMLKDQGHRVLMIGDGLNDTAALATAHASIAPSTALDAARNAADVVVLRTSFADLPLVLRVARFTRALSQQNFAIAAAYNFIAVPVALAGFATPLAAALAMSISSITVLANAQRMRFVK
ncbi:Nitrogen fixation protein FixI [Sulfitobacter noctilucae]|uniref:heavy metal translocating P-type ATPase n=1 Tax=Sulfitobacter noctilucae TaxID=1342302 RepID=UPI0004695E1F|nr:heavy metal translocating P-type ATPase [Sulfitobacter noctilucae]KIN60551.1 Nitrogen fixation protein FixI [Sulfitobacter noctilucae]